MHTQNMSLLNPGWNPGWRRIRTTSTISNDSFNGRTEKSDQTEMVREALSPGDTDNGEYQ